MPKPKPHQKKSIIKQTLEEKSSVKSLTDDFLVLSLVHLDQNQGDTFEGWQSDSILARAMNTLTGYCASSIPSQSTNQKFTIYGDFPPSSKTNFTHPNHVPEDAEWARIHVTGKQCIIGHVVRNTFYIVFLDSKHDF